MACDNCRTDGAPAYTLRAHAGPNEGGTGRGGGDGDVAVELEFCSFACLENWT